MTATKKKTLTVTTAALLKKYGACGEAIEWAKKHPDPKAAWAECERGEWMLWVAAKIGVDLKMVVRAACGCARLALPYTTDPRVKKCIEVTEAWCDGKATDDEVREARDAASAASAAYAAAAADAAYAAAYAAYAAYAVSAAYAYAAAAADAAYAAAYAAYAAYAVSAAYAAADAAADAKSDTLKKCAAIVRKVIPWGVVEKALK